VNQATAIAGSAPSAPPVALTVAGSDSGGGAGIQADLKTFQAFGVFGTSAVTAVTAQNTLGVTAIHKVPPELVAAQIAAVITDLDPAAGKTGMLADEPIIRAVADCFESIPALPLVVDPVMVAASGDPLLEESAVAALLEELLPLATLVTPNLEEAEILTGLKVRSEPGMRAAAEKLIAAGCGAVLVKGGHLEGTEVVDVLFDGAEWSEWRARRVLTRSSHGTGCTLSAAITAGLAAGQALTDAVERGIRFTRAALRNGLTLGTGHGPLSHWVSG
jgi:hydroxymethylpyrimidine/phosphomethylpyrimidine kinase